MTNNGKVNEDIIPISANGFTGELDRARGLSYVVGHIGGVWHWSAACVGGETKEANALSKAAAVEAAKAFLGWGNGSV